MRPSRALFVVALTFVPAVAWPQGDPAGPEFRVNTFTTGFQGFYGLAVAADPAGNFVVAWVSQDQDGSFDGIFGQRYSSSGVPLGFEFRVNSYTTGGQRNPSVAADAAGNFTVVWEGYGQAASLTEVFGQRYAISGAPLGAEFRVNSYTTSFQFRPAVAADSLGNFIVVWQSIFQAGSSSIFGQRYASSGAPLGPEFRVNTNTTDIRNNPSIAADSLGNFVVVWERTDGEGYGIFGQRYASSGAPLGTEFRVNTNTTGVQNHPSVASGSAGDFVVVWDSVVRDSSVFGVSAQRYASSGPPLGTEFRVNTYTTSTQNFASVAADSAGNFVVVWRSIAQDGSGYGVFGQRYVSTGSPLGPEFRVNTYTTGSQFFPFVTSDAPGNFVVVWVSSGQDGSSDGVFGQRYNMIVPVELMQFRVE